jgi:hypothetical protein
MVRPIGEVSPWHAYMVNFIDVVAFLQCRRVFANLLRLEKASLRFTVMTLFTIAVFGRAADAWGRPQP